MALKVVLVNPGTVDDYPHLPVYPPLGALCLAAVIRAAGYDVAILDYDRRQIDAARIRADLDREGADVVGVSVMTGPQLVRGLLVSEVAKDGGAQVVWGGPHPTVLPEQTLAHRAVDCVVIGEAEHTIVPLLRHLEGKRAIELYGLAIKDPDGTQRRYPPPPAPVDLDAQPLPAWDLVDDVDRYLSRIGEDHRPGARHRIKLTTTRSCRFRCAFCHQANREARDYLGCYRTADPRRVFDELDLFNELSNKKVAAVDFVDMLTLVDRDHVSALAEGFRKRGRDYTWYASSRHGVFPDELVPALARSGCEMLLFGIEAGSKRVRKMIGKPLDVPRCQRTLELLDRHGIYSIASYILGLPTETWDEVHETVSLMQQLPHSLNYCHVYIPIPGTPTYEQAIQLGRIEPIDSLNGWRDHITAGIVTNVSECDPEQLAHLNQEILLREYTRFLGRYRRGYLKRLRLGMYLRSFRENRIQAELAMRG